MIHNKVLQDSIEREKAGADYVCPAEDKQILSGLLDTINAECGTNIRYLAELDAFHVFGAGKIIEQNIDRFRSESVKAYLIPQLLLDKVKNSDTIILCMYQHFRKTNEYISEPGKPAPAHIYTRYDAAFTKLKSKRIAENLLAIVSCPRDAFYLPHTVKMLASWRIPELQKTLLRFLKPNAISFDDIGLEANEYTYFPPYPYICRELKFTAIYGLMYYPSKETVDALSNYLCDSDADIRSAANRAYKKVSAHKVTFK